jgi:hypothetical protein
MADLAELPPTSPRALPPKSLQFFAIEGRALGVPSNNHEGAEKVSIWFPSTLSPPKAAF